MRIRAIDADNLNIPYDVPYHPAWRPGFVQQSREFTLVRVYTDTGIVGYAGRDGHHAGTISRDVTPFLLGVNPCATEQHARILRNAGGMWFIDLAFWDIIGKAAGLPLYQLWGAFRDKVQAYASTAEVGTPENRAELAARYRSEGFQAMKLRLHADSIDEDLALLDRVREAVPGMTIMIDANQATNLPSPEPGPIWDYQRALRTARALEERGIYWLEEPLSRYDFDNLIRLRENTGISIAGGESNRQLHEFRWLIERGVYDIIQPDCALSEGISQLRKVAAMAELCKRHFVPHHGLSGIGLAGTLHLACSLPGLMWLEMMYEPPTRTIEAYQQLGGILESKIWIDGDGYVRPPEAPGLGIVVNEQRIPKYRQ
ncbi:MAG TPA: mandelate racemase/muconate lactonizing enzyme family protein [Chloroflexota bacterium]|jgi:L-alanine-DL-glutamate epimerase-like enolase superfamily enzyme